MRLRARLLGRHLGREEIPGRTRRGGLVVVARLVAGTTAGHARVPPAQPRRIMMRLMLCRDLRASAVTTREEILDQFIRSEFPGLARPRCGERASVDVLRFGQLARLGGDAGDVVALGGGAAEGAVLGRQYARDAAYYHRGFEGRGCEVHVPFCLSHADADFQGRVDFAVLEEIAARYGAFFFAFVLQVGRHVREARVFCQVQFYVAEMDATAAAGVVELLEDLEVQVAFLEVAEFVDREAHGEGLEVFPCCFVFGDGGGGRAAAVVGCCGGGEMPADLGSAG